MHRYVIRRIALLVPTLLGMSLLIFGMLRLIPGDVVDLIIGEEAIVSDAARQQMREVLGLNDPIPVQYVRWLSRVVQGDLGISLRTDRPVSEIVVQHIPITIELTILSMLFAVIIAVPLGVISAIRPNSWLDLIVRLGGMVGLSFPNFWLATLMILIASLYFNWLPQLIWVSPFEDPVENLKQVAFPVLALGTHQIAIIMRQTRSAMLEVLGQEYVRTAVAKGLRYNLVVTRHVLRNAWIPIVTIIGIQTGNLLSGAVIIEQIFGLPGVGWMLINGIFQRDYTVVQAAVVLMAVVFVVINLIVDLMYGYLDPRVRHA